MTPEPAPLVHVLAISGSLRAASSSSALLGAAALLAPEGMVVERWEGLRALPPFDPDEEADAPAPVRDFRARLLAADAVLLSSPEYAHGVPGALKNALDWVVGSGELYEKPVALLEASPRSTFVQAQLAETLRVMTADLVSPAPFTADLMGRRLGEREVAADPALAAAIRLALEALRARVLLRRG